MKPPTEFLFGRARSRQQSEWQGGQRTRVGAFIGEDPTQSHHTNNFDAIRLAMAILVVWSHSFAIYMGSEDNEPISLLMKGTVNAGNIGVLVFFIISGFLISQSFDRTKTLRTFFERRVRRIYPGYCAATAICAFVVIPIFSSRADLSAPEILKTVGLNLLLRNYFPPSDVFGGRTLNGSLWSIPFEFWCYIGLAFLGWSRLLALRCAIPVIAVVVMTLRVALDLTGHKPGGGLIEFLFGWPYQWTVILPCFLAGATLYLYRDLIPRNAIVATMGLGILALAANLPLDALYRQCLVNVIFPPAISYGVICLAFSSSINLRKASHFGDFSYGTYLYAFPIQQALFFVFDRKLTFSAYVLSSGALALSLGVISWFSVERWFLIRPASRLRPIA